MLPLHRRKYCLLIVMLVLAGCQLLDKTTPIPENTMDSNTFNIRTNAQLNYRDNNLHIGAGGFEEGTYTDEQGNQQRGATAGLWFAVSDKSVSPQFYRVHAGQVIAYGKYKVSVIEIGDSSIQVRIEEQAESPSEK